MTDTLTGALSRRRRAVLDFIINYKREHDGNTPGLAEIAAALSVSKSNVWQQVKHLQERGLLLPTAGGSRALAVAGSRWTWAKKRPLPQNRAGDVLRCIVEYKIAHNGNAPTHREIAACLNVIYSGAIREYLDVLEADGYVRTPYATDRTIEVVGGSWVLDEAAMWANWRDGPQMPLPFEKR